MRHLFPMQRHTGCFGDQRGIDVDDTETAFMNQAGDFFKEFHAGDIFILRVSVREQAADVPHSRSAQQRVTYGMRQDIRIRMAQEAFFKRYVHPPRTSFLP